MGMDQTVYIGCYLRVWMPRVTTPGDSLTCPKCGRISCGKFCSLDGTALIRGTVEIPESVHDLCACVFGDADRFSVFADGDPKSPTLVMANLQTQSGHRYLHDETETEIPAEDWSGDWQTLIAALEGEGIRFERRFGVVSTWS